MNFLKFKSTQLSINGETMNVLNPKRGRDADEERTKLKLIDRTNKLTVYKSFTFKSQDKQRIQRLQW